MKKKILSGVFALVLLATAGFGVHKSMKSDADLSDLALANVEALADNESSHDVDCSKKGGECKIKGPDGYEIIVLNFQKP